MLSTAFYRGPLLMSDKKSEYIIQSLLLAAVSILIKQLISSVIRAKTLLWQQTLVPHICFPRSCAGLGTRHVASYLLTDFRSKSQTALQGESFAYLGKQLRHNAYSRQEMFKGV